MQKNHNVGISLSFKMSSATTTVHTALVIRQTKRQLATTVVGRVLKEHQTHYDVCKHVKIFGGVYAKNTYTQAVKQAKFNVVNTDNSWSPGKHWFVVDHTPEPCVVFDSYGARSLSSSSEFWHGTLGTAYSFNDAVQGLTTNVCGDYCIFYVFFSCDGKDSSILFFLAENGGRWHP